MASDLKSIITARFKELNETYNSGDGKAVSAFYAEDCKLVFPGGEPRVGRATLEAAVKEMKEGGIKIGKCDITDVSGSPDGDVAYQVARVHTTTADGATAEISNSVMVWKKIGGNYLVQVEVSN
ncbi:uncharacterized protein LOC144438257 [Glandiceps talaboti]